MKLTVRHLAILFAIDTFVSEKGYPPTIRELAKVVGLNSSSTMHRHLERLRIGGKVNWDPSKPRTLTLVRNESESINTKCVDMQIDA